MSSWAMYLKTISKRLEANYDLFPAERIAGKTMDLVARFNMRNEKFFLLKKITLYAYENHETVLMKRVDWISAEVVEEFCRYLKAAMSELVDPSEEHMSSIVTGVLVATEGVVLKARPLIKQFRYSRNFKLLLQGWCDLRLLAVDLAANEVYSNKAGRSVREAYRSRQERGQ
ncbi:MAG TPA: hypothetical protein VJ036_04630 [bacterium]|nr:hypothetical protein [bacterium]